MKILFENTSFFPLSPSFFSHNLDNLELFSLNTLAEVAGLLPEEMIETNEVDKNINIVAKIRNIQSLSSWIMLRNIEQLNEYNLLMHTLLDVLIGCKIIEREYLLNPMSFVFITSPNVITPIHIDPEHNFLFQIKGYKKVLINNELLMPVISLKEISDFYKDEVKYKLKFKDEYKTTMTEYSLNSNRGVYIPVTYPHLVENGRNYSISYSLTFRTHFSENHRHKHLSL